MDKAIGLAWSHDLFINEVKDGENDLIWSRSSTSSRCTGRPHTNELLAAHPNQLVFKRRSMHAKAWLLVFAQMPDRHRSPVLQARFEPSQ